MGLVLTQIDADGLPLTALWTGFVCHVRSSLPHPEGQTIEFRALDRAGHDLPAVEGWFRDVVAGFAFRRAPVEDNFRPESGAVERPSSHEGQGRDDLVSGFAPPRSLDDVGLAVQVGRVERFAVGPLKFLVVNGIKGITLALTPVDARLSSFGVANVERLGRFAASQSEALNLAVGHAPHGNGTRRGEMEYHPKAALFAFGGAGEVPIRREAEIFRRLELVAGRDQEILHHGRSPAEEGLRNHWGSQSSRDYGGVSFGPLVTHLSLLAPPFGGGFPTCLAGELFPSKTIWTRSYILANYRKMSSLKSF